MPVPPPSGNQFRYSLTNSNEGGVLNIAQVGFETRSTSTVPVQIQNAQLIAYMVAAQGQWLTSGTLITRCQYREALSGGFVDLLYPDSQYSDLVALNADLPVMHDWGAVVLGASGGLAPVGTSICVTEYSAGFGRRSRGRHFLPFVGKAFVDGAGLMNVTTLGLITVAYDSYVVEGDIAKGSVPLLPVILSTTLPTQIDITHAKPQAVLSNLRSRRR